MLEFSCKIPVPQSAQELEQAISRYRTSDLQGADLFCQWEAIRNASLVLTGSDIPNDEISDEESY